MPSKNLDQAKFMMIACHNKKFADENGIDQKTACEFYEADKKKAKEEAKKKKAKAGKKGKKVSNESYPSIDW